MFRFSIDETIHLNTVDMVIWNISDEIEQHKDMDISDNMHDVTHPWHNNIPVVPHVLLFHSVSLSSFVSLHQQHHVYVSSQYHVYVVYTVLLWLLLYVLLLVWDLLIRLTNVRMLMFVVAVAVGVAVVVAVVVYMIAILLMLVLGVMDMLVDMELKHIYAQAIENPRWNQMIYS